MNQHIVTIAGRFKERSDALGLKGKRRDDAALHFACGYTSALPEEEQKKVGPWLALVLSVRGYDAIEDVLLATKEEAA